MDHPEVRVSDEIETVEARIDRIGTELGFAIRHEPQVRRCIDRFIRLRYTDEAIKEEIRRWVWCVENGE